MKRSARLLALSALPALGVLAVGPSAGAAVLPGTDSGAGFSGFSTSATATPLRLEIHEPTIPIPADPEVELNASYTEVAASTGPSATGRASALWPGAAVGEGLSTIITQLGLPSQLGAAGYPLQVNVQTPGDPSSASQEPLPGTVTTATAGDTETVAKAGYSADGDIAPDNSVTADPGSGSTQAPPDLLGALKSGNLSALGNLLTGSQQSNSGAPAPTTNPLGALGLLVGADGMSSVSSTTYSGPKVVATATSRVGQLSLLAGLVRLDSVQVTASTSSNLAGAKTQQSVKIGGLTIAGKSFALTSDGIAANGKTTGIPGLSDPTKMLAMLGITISLPAPVHSVTGTQGTVSAQGLRITIDTKPLRSKLPALPLGTLLNKLPSSASQLTSLLGALGTATPRIVIIVGDSSAQAQTVAGIGVPTSPSGPAPATGAGGIPPTSGTSGGVPTSPGSTGLPASAGAPPSAVTPVTTTPVRNTSALPGLPPLGSVPGMLTLAATLLALGVGWWFRRAAGVLFGAAGPCSHGLESGVPDLRKA